MVTFLVIIVAQPNQAPAPPLSLFPATLTSNPQLIENPVVLSPLFATLTQHVTPKSFACHSYKKLPGVGCLSSAESPRSLRLSVFLSSRLCHCHPEPRRGTCFSPPHCSLSTTHHSPARYVLSFDTVPNSFARAKMSCPLFSSKSKLFLQNTRGVYPPRICHPGPAAPSPSLSSRAQPRDLLSLFQPSNLQTILPTVNSPSPPRTVHYSLLAVHSSQRKRGPSTPVGMTSKNSDLTAWTQPRYRGCPFLQKSNSGMRLHESYCGGQD
jgi:hypothetical protein